MEPMLILGDYIFGLDTAAFQELNRDTKWNWGSQDVFQALPALQFTGWGEDTITLPGVIFPEYWGGTGQLDQLRALGDTGEPQTLITGRGDVLGEWVVKSVSEKQSIFAQRGVGRRQEFTVTLQKYGDGDAAGSALDAALSLAGGVAGGVGSVASGSSTLSGLAGVVSSALAGAGAAVSAMQAAQAAVAGATQAVAGSFGAALSAATTLQSAAGTALASVKGLTGTPSLVAATGAVAPLIDAASAAVQSATGASKVLAAGGAASSALVAVNRLAVTATGISGQVRSILQGFD